VTSLALGQPTGAVKQLTAQAEGASPAEIQQAVQLGQTGAKVGVPLNMSEAVSETAPATRLNYYVKALEATPEGAPLRVAGAARVAQVRNAVGNLADQIAPVTDPIMLGVRGQAAGEGALGELEAARTAAVNPSYTAAGPQTVPAGDVQAIANAARTQAAADKTGLVGPTLEKFADTLTPNGVPITDIENLDRIRKFYRDRMDLPAGSADAIPKEIAGTVNPHLQQLNALMEAHSPDFVAGKTIYQNLSRNVVDPALAGGLGKFRGTADLPAQTGAVYPNAPFEGQPAVTSQLLSRLGAQDASLPADLTRQYLTRALAEQTQSNIPGENQWGGAKFATQIAGNPIQRENLLTGIQHAAGPDVMQNASDVLDVLNATGKRLRAGSDTASNLTGAREVGAIQDAEAAAALHTYPFRIYKNLKAAIGLAVSSGERKAMVRIIQSPPEQWEGLIQQAQAAKAMSSPQARLFRSAAAALNAQNARNQSQ
jgi:hypothetical protein